MSVRTREADTGVRRHSTQALARSPCLLALAAPSSSAIPRRRDPRSRAEGTFSDPHSTIPLCARTLVWISVVRRDEIQLSVAVQVSHRKRGRDGPGPRQGQQAAKHQRSGARRRPIRGRNTIPDYPIRDSVAASVGPAGRVHLQARAARHGKGEYSAHRMAQPHGQTVAAPAGWDNSGHTSVIASRT